VKHTDASEFTQAKPASFGQWLLGQAHRSDAVGALAKMARLDGAFPRDGDAQAVSKRLNQLQADGEFHMALEDAELDWLAL